jgi:hypothetical protein
MLRKDWAQPVGQILPRLGFSDHAMIGNPFNLVFLRPNSAGPTLKLTAILPPSEFLIRKF